MRIADQSRMAWRGVLAHPARSLLTMLGIGVGIAAVVLLTSIGQGVRAFVLGEFTQFGTNLLAIMPGKTSTFGMSAAVIHTSRPLTVEDAESLEHLPHVQAIATAVHGNADVEWVERRRSTMVFGVGESAPEVWRLRVAEGRFLEEGLRAQTVLGDRVRRELFGQSSPLGQSIRIGGERYRVVGTMEAKGQFLGMDMDDAVYIPTRRAMRLFNLNGVQEVDVLYAAGSNVEALEKTVRETLVARHGQEDFTIVTQQQMLDVLDSVLGVLTFAVGALGGVSLLVGGVGVLTIMTIAVSERTGEVGLLRALGADSGQVLALFLGEAVALAALGGLLGLLLGVGGVLLIALLLPALPVALSPFYLALAEAIAVTIGLAAGVLPARRAAGMEPVRALRAE
ncbi:MAG: ABC transporter permease [Gammaproteobacteria bacterium]|nr:ABC transporter permease [Gammaproteobacteria bacterium]